MTIAIFSAPRRSPFAVVNCCVLARFSPAARFSVLLPCVWYAVLEMAEVSAARFEFEFEFKKNTLVAVFEKSTRPTRMLFELIVKVLTMEFIKLSTDRQLEQVVSDEQIALELSTMNTMSARV